MATPSTVRPASDEYDPFFTGYISLVPDGDVLEALEQGRNQTNQLLGKLSEARAAYRYAPGKWSIKGVLGHLADAERVFALRALWFARGSASPLPGWDENAWAGKAGFDARTLDDLLQDYDAARGATLSLFRSLPAEAWERRGTANDNPVTVRALAWIAAGHGRHHLKILRERYLLE
jgi:uncharacterized damage-inducible protein DinB